MGSLKTTVLAGLSALASVGAAMAADMNPPILSAPPVAVHAAPMVDTGGWYLRGDIGVGVTSSSRFRLNPLTTGIAGAGGSIAYDYTSTSPFFFAGAGIGYAFNSWFRADVTFEYRGGSTFRGRDSIVDPTALPAPGAVLRNAYNGNLSSMVTLANAYVDLGTWHGLTPFVGAGVGYAMNSTSVISDTGSWTTGAATSGFFQSGSKGGMAWALMAGLGWDVSPTTRLELGYRYLNLGDFRSGALACAAACPATTTGAPIRLEVRNVVSHDIRLSMRWLFNTPVAPIAHVPVVARN